MMKTQVVLHNKWETEGIFFFGNRRLTSNVEVDKEGRDKKKFSDPEIKHS